MRKNIIIVFLISWKFTSSQNLVINPSFEDSIPCAVYQGPPQMQCSNWFWATNGSPDFYTNVCSNSFYGVPQNAFGYQIPRTGTTYCGIATYNYPIPIPNYREYLEGALIDTLKQGHTYCVSFYVVNTDSAKYYSPDIGAFLSTDSIFDQDSDSTLPFTPQISNTNGFIYDTLNWVQISGSFIAQGGEKFITIGNFKNDLNTILDSNNQTNMFYGGAYFYIDDVSVVDCTTGINELQSSLLNLFFEPNPVKENLSFAYDLKNKNDCFFGYL